MKLLTIVTVTFNAERTIEKTIQSVLSQSARELIEYIVVDGASKDRTTEIITQYKEDIDVFISEKDNGIFDAMNKGASLAISPWILFMNAGDTLYDTDTVASLHELMTTEKAPLIYGDCVRVWPDGRKETRKAEPFFTKQRCIPGIGICHQSIYMKTDLLLSHPFRWQEYPHCADLDLLQRLRIEDCPMHYEPRPLCYYAYGEGFTSNKQAAQIVMEENASILGLRHSWIYYKQRLWQLFQR